MVGLCGLWHSWDAAFILFEFLDFHVVGLEVIKFHFNPLPGLVSKVLSKSSPCQINYGLVATVSGFVVFRVVPFG